MPSNAAAWITELKTKPLVVKEAPYTSPGPDEVLVKNAAVAVNPVDWKIQESGRFLNEYPNILGCDVAGEIVEVGEDVKNFEVGQRVLGHSPALMTQKSSQAGFQLYTVLPTTLVSRIPSSLTFSAASVLPLALSTAAAGLYQKDFLNLPHPSTSPTSTGESLLVWGGSSSVGSSAIQLAKASGYEVITTASKPNHSYCRELGVAEVLDYHDSDIVDALVGALKGKKLAGIYDAVATDSSIEATLEIAAKTGVKKIANVRPGSDNKSKGDVSVLPVFAISILHNEVGPAIYRDFVPKALEGGQLKAKPDPTVVGHSLENVQEGMDKLKAGISAGKIVITL